MKSLVLLFSRNAQFSETLIEKNLVFLLYREVLAFLQNSGISTCDSNYSEKRNQKNRVFIKAEKRSISESEKPGFSSFQDF